MKYLAIDYGKKRIGLALGEIIPKGAGFIDGQKPAKIIEKIIKICNENEVEKIIIGLPTTNSGTGEVERSVKTFGKELGEQSGREIIFEQENYTSTEAERILKEGKAKGINKGDIDEMAAVLILEQYLNERRDN